MSEDEFDEQPTPDPNAPRLVTDESSGLTESQRDHFAARFASRAPVVQTRDTPRPHVLLARTSTPDEIELVRHLRLAGDKTALAEFAVKMFAEVQALRRDLNAKIEADSSDNQSALEELRALLSRPPNGRVAKLQERVDELERMAATERSTDTVREIKDDHRLKQLEADARFARRVAYSVLAFVFVSAGGLGLWLRGTGVAEGIDKQRLEYAIDAGKDRDRKLEEIDRKIDRWFRWPQAAKDITP